MSVVNFGPFERPRPPQSLLDVEDLQVRFVPAPELLRWFRSVFIEEGGPLHNPEHEHLQQATIGALWTRVPNARHGNTIVGTAELGEPRAMGKWPKARATQQIEEWFGEVPDFIMTIFAEYAETCDDIEFCALIEHELMHMGQERDEFGALKFRQNGRPAFAMRGHDVEEFVSIVARYGAGAGAGATAALVQAANRGPTIGATSIARACGTCQERRVA